MIDTKSLDALNALGLALPSEEKAQKKRLNHQARLLAKGLLALPEAKGLKITRLLREGKPFVEIARTVREEKIDLVVMGSYGGQTGDISHIFFGSTAEKIVRTVPCPVLTVPYPFKNLATQVDIKSIPFHKAVQRRNSTPSLMTKKALRPQAPPSVSHHSSNQGQVLSIRGSVVDVQFPHSLPSLHHILLTGKENQVIIETIAHLDKHTIRAIALTPTHGPLLPLSGHRHLCSPSGSSWATHPGANV